MAKATTLEGVHYVLTDERTPTGKRKRRKPTMAELESRKALLDRYQAESDAIRADGQWHTTACAHDGPTPARSVLRWIEEAEAEATWGLPPVRPNTYRKAFAAEYEARKASCAPERKRRATPAKAKAPAKRKREPKAKVPQMRDPDAPRSAKQVYGIAARALKVLGYDFPDTKGEAHDLIVALEAKLA